MAARDPRRAAGAAARLCLGAASPSQVCAALHQCRPARIGGAEATGLAATCFGRAHARRGVGARVRVRKADIHQEGGAPARNGPACDRHIGFDGGNRRHSQPARRGADRGASFHHRSAGGSEGRAVAVRQHRPRPRRTHVRSHARARCRRRVVDRRWDGYGERDRQRARGRHLAAAGSRRQEGAGGSCADE